MPGPQHRTDRSDRSSTVRIPADIDRPDRVLANLTARQVAILATVGALQYGVFAATRTVLSPVVFLIAAVPIVVAAGVLVLGTRDGLSLDRLLVAAIRQRLTPRIQVAADGDVTAAPDWVTARAFTPAGERYQGDAVAPTTLRLPAQAIGPTADGAAREIGVVDLGPDGLAVVCVCSTVNFALRTDTEQEALVASFGRYLHSLSAPIQILIRAQRLDLSGQIAELRQRAASLPHPALEVAAHEHADYLTQLADQADVGRRQVLLVLREPAHLPGRITTSRLLLRLIPTPHSASSGVADAGGRRAAEVRLARRVTESVSLLATAGVVVTPLDAGQATAVLAAACNPESLIRPDTPLAAAGDVITLTAPESDLTSDRQPAGQDPSGTAPVEAIDADSPDADHETWWTQ